MGEIGDFKIGPRFVNRNIFYADIVRSNSEIERSATVARKIGIGNDTLDQGKFSCRVYEIAG